mmetsp:Transcript_39334/g.47927  ORF Transcript_39334/g.47927 Transcript_39334/m.47927 type:complete len:101 (-) Transcript_39334:103-405(-)
MLSFLGVRVRTHDVVDGRGVGPATHREEACVSHIEGGFNEVVGGTVEGAVCAEEGRDGCGGDFISFALNISAGRTYETEIVVIQRFSNGCVGENNRDDEE